MNSLINITNLTIKYENKSIIDNISITIDKPKIISILGKSGSGKSTLFSAILNFIKYEGVIDINKKCKVCYMPQGLALIDNLTVYENVIIPLKINNIKIEDEKINNILTSLKISELKNQKVTRLSGGQKSRVALARTLVDNNNILLIDEALSSVDEITKFEILQTITEMATKYSLLILYITHDIHEACEISDEIIILKDQKITTLNTIDNSNNFKNYIRNLL